MYPLESYHLVNDSRLFRIFSVLKMSPSCNGIIFRNSSRGKAIGSSSSRTRNRTSPNLYCIPGSTRIVTTACSYNESLDTIWIWPLAITLKNPWSCQAPRNRNLQYLVQPVRTEVQHLLL